ncbi:MAG: hypothetical protein ABJA98_02865 [Acidobacteriota bacterium]
MLKGLTITLLLALGVLAQPPSPLLSGSWIATTARNQVYRGQWSGQLLPGRPDAAQGSWLVLNDASRIVQQGTWAAEKSKQGWRGQWSVRMATGRQPSGTVLSGTWQTTADSTIATLAELLQQTLQQQVAGSWRSGQLGGNWWLKGPSSK